ncbi:LysR family transcriptional regulator [Roseibium sp. RKSG952]|uniref:LysR family transcriptional regulator n=1 Tax=Roseibium sp. RKSG952 TaxID=2529384 RepID=UPI0012BC3CA3|nr:LysR family transcriptional regulator [Roseibium sp. RKSG952]MTH98854.1 LysR family transcriptional regulator [Roseibium sp. RKSG952]
MSRLPNLQWLRSFEAVSRHGSFTAAGAELGLTQAAISTHIGSLEAGLGHALFERSTRKVALTEIGKAYLPAVRRAFDDLMLSTDGLFGGWSEESITIRAPISTAALVIAPRLPDLLAVHPHLNIRLVSSIWAESQLEEDIDIDLRLGHGRWPGCHADPVGAEAIAPVASRVLADKIRNPDDLAKVPLIHILGFEDHWSRYFSAVQLDPGKAARRITVDTTLAAIEMAAADGGAALILDRAVDRLAAQGRVQRVLDVRIPLGQGHFLIEPTTARPPRLAVELVRNWLRDLFIG